MNYLNGKIKYRKSNFYVFCRKYIVEYIQHDSILFVFTNDYNE